MGTLIPYTVAHFTLGCKVNQYDSDVFLQGLRARGFRVVPFDDVADVYIINSCTVTSTASRKSRQMIRSARRRNPDALIVMAGCYLEVAESESDPEFRRLRNLPVDVWIRMSDRAVLPDKILEHVAGRQPVSRVVSPEVAGDLRVRKLIKVQEGCDEFCTYCIVPYARGPLRSRLVPDIKWEVQEAVDEGHREIVLTGVHLGAYDRALDAEHTLAELVEVLVDIPGNWRLRLSSLEPMDLEEELLRVMGAHSRVAHHLHIPLQSGSDSVLRRMGRRYSVAQFHRLIGLARQYMPDVGVTTDVMVGFPGETDQDHRQTLTALESLAFSRIHVFPYSPRPGTRAADMPHQVPAAVKRNRRDDMLRWARYQAAIFHRQQLGRRVTVLVEDIKAADEVPFARGFGRQAWYYGYTGNYVPVWFPAFHAGQEGLFCSVRVTSAAAEGCAGVQSTQPKGCS